MMQRQFAVGTLVRAPDDDDRDWVVLPESDEEMLVLGPLGGTEDEVTGIDLRLEAVESTQFDLPNPTQRGDYRSCRLLRDAVRLGFRSSAEQLAGKRSPLSSVMATQSRRLGALQENC